MSTGMALEQLNLFAEPVKIPDQMGRASIVIAPTSQILAPASGFMDCYDFTLNPYRGCAFGCSYCYAAFFVPDAAQREHWGDWVEIKTGALDQLKRKRKLAGKKIYMSSVTDPYQPVERKTELTRSILEFLAEPSRQPRLVIQTRSPLVTRDIDILKQFEHLRINFTITTDDDEIRKRFEPGCPSNERRLQALEECQAAGLRVGISVAPMLPVRDIDAFAKRLADYKADRYVTQPFKASNGPFAANTRQMAKDIADEYQWTEREYTRAISTLRRLIPEMYLGKEGFGPV